MNNINYDVLDKLLLGLLDSSDVSYTTKQQIEMFVQNHDLSVFDNESAKILAGWWRMSLSDTYKFLSGEYLPNIFVRNEA